MSKNRFTLFVKRNLFSHLTIRHIILFGLLGNFVMLLLYYFFFDIIFIRFGTKIMKQIVGIMIGTICAPAPYHVAN